MHSGPLLIRTQEHRSEVTVPVWDQMAELSMPHQWSTALQAMQRCLLHYVFKCNNEECKSAGHMRTQSPNVKKKDMH